MFLSFFLLINGCKSPVYDILNEFCIYFFSMDPVQCWNFLKSWKPRMNFLFHKFGRRMFSSSSSSWCYGRPYTIKVLEMSGIMGQSIGLFIRGYPHYEAYSLWQRGTSNLHLFSVRNPYENQHGGWKDPAIIVRQQYFLPAN